MRSPSSIVNLPARAVLFAMAIAIAGSPGSVGAQIRDRLTNPKAEIVVTHPPRVVLT